MRPVSQDLGATQLTCEFALISVKGGVFALSGNLPNAGVGRRSHSWDHKRPWGLEGKENGQMMMITRGVGLRPEAEQVLQYMLWLERIMPLHKLPWKQINCCVVDELKSAGLIEQKVNNPSDSLNYAVTEAHLTERGRCHAEGLGELEPAPLGMKTQMTLAPRPKSQVAGC
jgi:hypothetical protein